MKKYKYYVIGGQYKKTCYGGSNSLRGAKMIATNNVEYWDNWQGWHTPDIYLGEDLAEREDGEVYVPRYDGWNPPVEPISRKSEKGWVDDEARLSKM